MPSGAADDLPFLSRKQKAATRTAFSVFSGLLLLTALAAYAPEVGKGAAARQAIATPQKSFALEEVADAARFARSHTHAGEFFTPTHLSPPEQGGFNRAVRRRNDERCVCKQERKMECCRRGRARPTSLRRGLQRICTLA